MSLRIRELFNHRLSPVVLGAFAVIVVVGGATAFSRRTDSVDPRVTFRQDTVSYRGRAVSATAARRLAAAMNGEVSHTADRLADATSLTLYATLYLANSGLKGRLPRDVQSLILGLEQNQLLPPGLTRTEFPGTLSSPWGSLSVRYRPAPLGIEVISLASKPEYGPAMIVRLPDDVLEKDQATLYIASRLQDVTLPAPFAPAAQLIALGWSPERLRSIK